ncbi:MAG: hypothetical protein ABJQ70_16000 [Roseobacter sp.]
MEPQVRLGVAALAKVAFDGGDFAPLRSELVAQCLNGSESASAMMDLSVVEQIFGNPTLGMQLQSQALEKCRTYRTHRPQAAKKTVLVYAAEVHMGGNTPVEFLLPNDDFDIVTYYPDVTAKGGIVPDLPAHDVAFCSGPADSEDAEYFFERVRGLSKENCEKVLNLPEKLIKPERDTLPELLSRIDRLRIPKTIRIDRSRLEKALQDGIEEKIFSDVGRYPFVVRPVGSHAGLGLAKLKTGAEFLTYLAGRTEEIFFVGEYVDYASEADKNFRKYRVVLVDGKAFPCHMAISNQWDVWYMNSNMAASEEKRQEEQTFMDHFESEFAKRHQGTFAALASGLGLDYFGLDCAEDREGNLVVFEVDNALIVHDMDCQDTFPYKKKHMRRIFTAFGDMLSQNCLTLERNESRTCISDGTLSRVEQHALA